jgi:hypothetical protein
MMDETNTVVWCFDFLGFPDVKTEDQPDINPSADPLLPAAMPAMPALRVLVRNVTFTPDLKNFVAEKLTFLPEVGGGLSTFSKAEWRFPTSLEPLVCDCRNLYTNYAMSRVYVPLFCSTYFHKESTSVADPGSGAFLTP